MSTDPLLAELLAKPVGPSTPARQTDPEKDFTRQIEVSGNTAVVTVRGPASEADESAATTYLRSKGEDPALWEVTGFRSGEWSMANGEMGVSNRYTFSRIAGASTEERPPLDDLIAEVKKHKPVKVRPQGDHGYLVLLGDMQFGKIDGDGVEGTLRRTIDCLNKAADSLMWQRQRFDIGHVHIGWLGDHIEGFVSQGGANVWRTPLTLNEQIRLTRRVMLHALTTFAPLAERLTMAAVPGNHGDPQRFEGKGVTRYDDSHDTESLIAVADAAALNEGAFGHVEFYVPETDELIVVVEVANTVVSHAHGHFHRPGKHFEWWRDQAFNPQSPMHMADIHIEGHLHHEEEDTDGHRRFIGVGALESESTWYRHSRGTGGAPGITAAVVKDHHLILKESIR